MMENGFYTIPNWNASCMSVEFEDYYNFWARITITPKLLAEGKYFEMSVSMPEKILAMRSARYKSAFLLQE